MSSTKGDFVTDVNHTGNGARDFETELASMNSRRPSAVPLDKALPERVVSPRKVSFQSGISKQKDSADKTEEAIAGKLRQTQQSLNDL